MARGWARSIGVSNFTVRQLEHVLSFASIPPAVNQIEMHPYLLQPDLLRFCRQHNVMVPAPPSPPITTWVHHH